MEQIDWSRFDIETVHLETGTPKRMTLTNWRQGAWFNMPGIQFEVLGGKTKRVFTTTSQRLVRALKPCILAAERGGKNTIDVTILRIGEGFSTDYDVKDHGNVDRT